MAHPSGSAVCWENAPFKTQLGVGAEWLEAAPKSEIVTALWVLEYEAFLFGYYQKENQRNVGGEESAHQGGRRKRGCEGKSSKGSPREEDFIFLALEHSLPPFTL